MPGIAIIIPRSGGTGPVIPDWTPTDLGADLFAWYDPRQGADGTTVSSLATTAGAGPALSANAGAPKFAAEGMNRTPAIRFDGASSLRGALSLSGPVTVLANLQFTGSSTQYAIDGHATSSLSFSRSLFSDTFGVRRGAGSDISVSPSDAAPHSHVAVFDGASSRYYIDGAETAGTLNTLNVTAFTLGAAGGATSFLTGHIGDVVVVTRALTASEAAAADGWLKARRRA